MGNNATKGCQNCERYHAPRKHSASSKNSSAPYCKRAESDYAKVGSRKGRLSVKVSYMGRSSPSYLTYSPRSTDHPLRIAFLTIHLDLLSRLHCLSPQGEWTFLRLGFRKSEILISMQPWTGTSQEKSFRTSLMPSMRIPIHFSRQMVSGVRHPEKACSTILGVAYQNILAGQGRPHPSALFLPWHVGDIRVTVFELLCGRTMVINTGKACMRWRLWKRKKPCAAFAWSPCHLAAFPSSVIPHVYAHLATVNRCRVMPSHLPFIFWIEHNHSNV